MTHHITKTLLLIFLSATAMVGQSANPPCEDLAKQASDMLQANFGNKISYSISCNESDAWKAGMTDGGSYTVKHPISASEQARALAAEKYSTIAFDREHSTETSILAAHGFTDWIKSDMCMEGFVHAKEGYIEEYIPKNPNWDGPMKKGCRAVYAVRRKQVKFLDLEPSPSAAANKPKENTYLIKPAAVPESNSKPLVLNDSQQEITLEDLFACVTNRNSRCLSEGEVRDVPCVIVGECNGYEYHTYQMAKA